MNFKVNLNPNPSPAATAQPQLHTQSRNRTGAGGSAGGSAGDPLAKLNRAKQLVADFQETLTGQSGVLSQALASAEYAVEVSERSHGRRAARQAAALESMREQSSTLMDAALEVRDSMFKFKMEGVGYFDVLREEIRSAAIALRIEGQQKVDNVWSKNADQALQISILQQQIKELEEAKATSEAVEREESEIKKKQSENLASAMAAVRSFSDSQHAAVQRFRNYTRINGSGNGNTSTGRVVSTLAQLKRVMRAADEQHDAERNRLEKRMRTQLAQQEGMKEHIEALTQEITTYKAQNATLRDHRDALLAERAGENHPPLPISTPHSRSGPVPDDFSPELSAILQETDRLVQMAESPMPLPMRKKTPHIRSAPHMHMHPHRPQKHRPSGKTLTVPVQKRRKQVAGVSMGLGSLLSPMPIEPRSDSGPPRRQSSLFASAKGDADGDDDVLLI